jgi:Family of unknown function (DUF5681)
VQPPKDRRGTSSNYRKPPVAHQFKKGVSGNPNGRPKKKAAQPGPGSLGGISDRLSAMALDEATRPVTVREGEKISELPALQALFRTMFRAAAQGDTKAARQLLEIIARAEGGRADAALKFLQHAIEYKETLLPIFEQQELLGRDPPDIYPHPDDIIIDDLTGEVTIDGPTSKEQAGAQKEVRALAIESLRRFFKVEAALEKDPTNRALKREFKELKKFRDFLQKDFDRNARHEALRISRRALRPKPPEQKRLTADDDRPDEA